MSSPCRLQWVRVGSDVPLPGRVLHIHLRELRPFGAGTATEEWALIEYEEVDGASAVGSAQPNPDGESSGGLGVPG